MPLYVCNAKRGILDETAKQKIAQDITDVHCTVTGAPASFVHAMFFEESPQFPLDEKTLYVRGTIRKGRTGQQKQQITDGIRESLIRHGGDRAAGSGSDDSRDACELGSRGRGDHAGARRRG